MVMLETMEVKRRSLGVFPLRRREMKEKKESQGGEAAS